jgi:hypothetical protein
MFGERSTWISKRHIPATELSHLGIEQTMLRIKR